MPYCTTPHCPRGSRKVGTQLQFPPRHIILPIASLDKTKAVMARKCGPPSWNKYHYFNSRGELITGSCQMAPGWPAFAGHDISNGNFLIRAFTHPRFNDAV